MNIRTAALTIAVCCAATCLHARETIQGGVTSPAAERMHEELRVLRDGLVKATNESNIDALLTHLHPNVVITWQNAEVSRGRAGVRDYLQRMMSGPNAVVRRFRTTPTVDELTIPYGGDAVGVAFGSSVDRFELTTGTVFELNGRWSATLVKEEGRWLVANFHASTNLFDNPVLNLTKRTTVWSGLGGLVIGALVATGGAALLRRRHRP